MGLIHEDFLLQTEQARRLYHDFAEDLPIIDYHCHLPPRQVADDARWETLTQIWLYGDHYKWRAMRSNGVDERFCTGDAGDFEKFQQYAATMPYLLRNPLYHWSHLELKRYFGIDDILGPDNARDIYNAANAVITAPDFSARQLMTRSNVVLVCTTDDPVDDLGAHRAIADDNGFDVQVYPTWRPDKGMAVEDPAAFNGWVDQLADAAGVTITTFDDYLTALKKRHDFFHEVGCRLSDHGIETAYGEDFTDAEIAAIFRRLRNGETLDQADTLTFKSAMLYHFGVMDHARGWTQQFHFGAMRNNNTRLFERLGPDTGFDSIGDYELARPLSRLLDRLDRENKLARTILYNLNPRDFELLATMLGNFQDGSEPGKMQLGSGWWFLDTLPGMARQIDALSSLGLLRRFVGMLTDSRSFLSYTRHEYFRRLLCNILGEDMHKGLIHDDLELVGQMVRDISYRNAARYFGFDVPTA
jgi:glucuronate isomerase